MAGVQWVKQERLAGQTEQSPNLPLTTPAKVGLLRAIVFRQEERWGVLLWGDTTCLKALSKPAETLIESL